MKKGSLYVVATPIGNLADITERAVDTLKSVPVIAAEDTRQTRKLLSSLGIKASLISLHDHNERARSKQLVEKLAAGEDVAIVSDAGTPMISDPGFHFIRAAQDAGIRVVPIPGPSAVATALSAAGLPANRFYFAGFLPEKSAARRQFLESLALVAETLVFYESGRRLQSSLEDMGVVLGEGREAVVAKELTKVHETIRRQSLGELAGLVETGEIDARGEFVLLVEGATETDGEVDLQLVKRLLQELGDSLPAGQVASAISKALKCPRKVVYQMALDMKAEE